MKPAKGKTWTDKVNDPTKMHQVKKLDKEFADMPSGSTMLIATPKIINDYIAQIPKGTGSNLSRMRKDLADVYHAEYTCPVTSGIFLRIISEAAYEQIAKGTPINKVTPFWRVIDEKSALNKKFSFGPDFVINQRKKEGLLKK
jgi:hypothetical protein